MWGLHIMDLQTREDSHNPFVIVFGSLALLGALLGTALLFRRRKVRASA
jgi:nitrate reductase gamma subunit